MLDLCTCGTCFITSTGYGCKKMQINKDLIFKLTQNYLFYLEKAIFTCGM